MTIAAGQLQSFIARIEKLTEEKQAIADDIREVFAEAKSAGFDVKIINKVIKLRAMDAQERAEQEQLLEVYLGAIGDLAGTPLGDASKPVDGDVDDRPADEIPAKIEEAKALLQTKEPRDDGRLSGCVSYVQRKMGLGYNTAGRILDRLEKDGVISAADDQGYRTLSPRTLAASA